MVETLASAEINVLVHYYLTRGRISADLVMTFIQYRLDAFLDRRNARRNTYGMIR